MSVKKGAMFRKVKVLKGKAEDDAKKMGLSPDDLVILFDDQHIEKVEGDPVSYLLKRTKGTSEVKKGSEIIKELQYLTDKDFGFDKPEKYGHATHVRIEFVQKILDGMVLVPEEKWLESEMIIVALKAEIKAREEERERMKTLIENLYQRFHEMILGEPAVFGEKTEYDKGYSKGYYDAKVHLQKLIEELRRVIEE